MKQIYVTMLAMMMLSSLLGIEVGGHISEDSTWSPEHNPYIITSFLYIDEGVLLTILPGTQILCTGADKGELVNFWFNGSEETAAKMIIVNGAINAIGTKENPILFDKYQADADFRWCGIFMSPNAPKSTFEYCEFRHSYVGKYNPYGVIYGALEFGNGTISVRSCTFENNFGAISSSALTDDIVIYDCMFISINDSYPLSYPSTSMGTFFFAVWNSQNPTPTRYPEVTIASCYFKGTSRASVSDYIDVLYLNNVIDGSGELATLGAAHEDYDDSHNIKTSEHTSGNRWPERRQGLRNSYGNFLINSGLSSSCYSELGRTAFFRKNTLIKHPNMPPLDNPLTLLVYGDGRNYISDNRLYGSVQMSVTIAQATMTYIYNNIMEHYEPNIAIDMRYWDPDYFPTQQARKIYNNLVRYIGDSPSTFIFSDPIPIDIYNNTVLNYSQLFSYDYFHDEQVYANNIIQCDDWTASTINEDYHPLFISNCLPYPFAYPWDILDGGGNIAADPMFADVSNDDYTLAAGSPCIDAGMMRPDLPEFDLRYHRRVAAGADGEDGVVDMGAYEYNSVYIGGINGYAYDSESGLPVDCVKIEISNKLPEFSDSLGCFNYPCGAGTFTVKASRWDYEDLIIPNVLVTLGEDTMLNIPLVWTNVTIDDESLPPKPADFGLSNHPNPFNPSTRLSFIAPETGELKLDIYNIKGQKVRTLYHGFISEGYHQIVWDGRDEKGVGIGSGICFAKIEMNGRRQIHKMMLMK